MSDLSASKNSSLFGCVSFAFSSGKGSLPTAGGSDSACAALLSAVFHLSSAVSLRSSTTDIVTGSVIGVGAARKVSAVHWNIATNIVMPWIVTLPASGLMAALSYVVVRFFSH
jgi:PiT family inorganic phosphate transporter